MDRCRQPFSKGLAVKSLREVAGEFVVFCLWGGDSIMLSVLVGRANGKEDKLIM